MAPITTSGGAPSNGKWHPLGKDKEEACRIAVGRAVADAPYDRSNVTAHQRFIYIIGIVGKSAPVKIGHAGHPFKRMADLQTAHPERLEMRACFAVPVDKGRSIEARMHLAYEEFRMEGEWFDVPFEGMHEWIELVKHIY